MEIEEIVAAVRAFEGVLVVTPDESSGLPELVWGDVFLYFAPDGVMPERTQPYATIITKDYPDDASSRLDEAGRFRVNVHVGRDRAVELAAQDADPAASDAFAPHPFYGSAGWVSVVNPAAEVSALLVSLLRDAHDAARARSARRSGDAGRG